MISLGVLAAGEEALAVMLQEHHDAETPLRL